MDIEIRQAKSHDIAALMELLRTCTANMRSHGVDQWDDVYPDSAIIQRDIQDGTAFVATTAGIIVGMATLNEHQEPEYLAVPWCFSGCPGVIHRLMIALAAEGKGIARALMGFLEARGSHLGYNCIRLDAFVENARAVQFYERSLYRRAGQVRFRKGRFYCYEKRL